MKIRLPIIGVVLTSIIFLPTSGFFLWALIDSFDNIKWYLWVFIWVPFLVLLAICFYVYLRFFFFYLTIDDVKIVSKNICGKKVVLKENIKKITVIKNAMYPRLLPDAVSRIVITYYDNVLIKKLIVKEGDYSTRKAIKFLKQFNYEFDYLIEKNRRP